MSIQLIQPKLARPVLSLNIRNVTALFPGFCEGDFAVIHGSSSATTLTSLLCVRGQLASQLGGMNTNIVFIDGGNNFDVYYTAQLARLHHLDAKQVLDNIYISRAFTAYQITALVMQKLKKAISKFNAKLVIISDIAGFFLDKDIAENEARKVFSQVTSYLSNFARENQVVLIATFSPHDDVARNNYLQSIVCASAEVVLSLNKKKHTRIVALEKHPYLTLGSVELRSNTTTLSDFLEGND
jgi:hypothetical protein